MQIVEGYQQNERHVLECSGLPLLISGTGKPLGADDVRELIIDGLKMFCEHFQYRD